MYTGTYKLAGRTIGIASQYEKVQTMCGDYATQEAPQYTVTITPEDIAAERRLSDEQNERDGLTGVQFSEAYLETLAVYRKIADLLLEENVLLFHGSVVSVDGEAYCFTAKSGTGKSTHTRLWRQLLGEKAVMVNDDKPLLEVTGERVIAYGTPWNGKHNISNNIAVPLRAICILERGAENSIRAISVKEALPMLMQQSHRPKHPAVMPKYLDVLDGLARHVRFYRLQCNMDLSAAELSYGVMSETAK